jgi:hypothetical protein
MAPRAGDSVRVFDRGVTTASDRLIKRILQDFEHERVDAVLEHLGTIPQSLPLGSSQDPERMQAAVVLPARGNFEAFLGLLRLAEEDWRDALVGAGLGDCDWAARLDDELGTG